ncbi:unnamed protein product [Lathyrus oleraceus]
MTEVSHPTETKVPHTSEMAEMSHPSEAEATTTTEVTSKINVTALRETNVFAPHENTHASTDLFVHMNEGFSGGPNDYSVLTGYADHGAFRLWQGEDCLLLKVPTHGLKLKKFSNVEMPPEMKAIVEDYALLLKVDNSLTMLNGQLLTTFVERRHKETSSFHLSFGEMKIALDDDSSLFHILLAGSFFIAPIIS